MFNSCSFRQNTGDFKDLLSDVSEDSDVYFEPIPEINPELSGRGLGQRIEEEEGKEKAEEENFTGELKGKSVKLN